MIYRVSAQVSRDTGNGWVCTIGVPAFLLDGEFHGLRTCKEAQKFAQAMVESLAGECSTAFVDVIGWEDQ